MTENNKKKVAVKKVISKNKHEVTTDAISAATAANNHTSAALTTPSIFDENKSFMFRLAPRFAELRLIFEEGVIPALYEAIELALGTGAPPPDWVLEGALRVVGDRIKFGFSTGKGASGNELAKHKNNMKRFARWWVVRHFSKGGMTLDHAFEEAHLQLKGKFGKGTYRTMKNSYAQVENDLKDPKKSYRYFLGGQEAQELTGMFVPHINVAKKQFSKSSSGKK